MEESGVVRQGIVRLTIPMGGHGRQGPFAAVRVRHAWNTMGDQIDLVLRHSVDLAEERHAVCAHHDEAFRELGNLIHGAALQGIGFPEDGVQRGHDRHA